METPIEPSRIDTPIDGRHDAVVISTFARAEVGYPWYDDYSY